MFHHLLHSFAYFIVSTFCTEMYIKVCHHVTHDRYRHSKNKFVVNFNIFIFFSNIKHSVIARIAAGFLLLWLPEMTQNYPFLWPVVGRVAQSVERLATAWTVRGSNTGGGEIFRTCPDRPWGPSSLLYSGYRVFPGGKERPGCDVDPSPPSSAMVLKGQNYTSTPRMGRTACTEPQCLYKGALYFYLINRALKIFTKYRPCQ
jgi:hypothetical protein